MSPKLLLFDFDGTLADSYAFILSLIPKLTNKYQLKHIADINDLRGLGAKEVMKEVGITFWKLPFIVSEVRTAFRKELATIPMFTKIPFVLQELKQQGHSLCVLTSNGTQNATEYFVLNNLDVFDAVYGDIGMFAKTKAINKVVKKYKFEKQNVIYIGDEVRDIEAAKKAQVKSMAVSWGLTTKDRLTKTNPDYIVSDPKEIIKIAQQ